VLSKCLAELVVEVRELDSRSPKTSLLIVDAQSVKNTDTAMEKGYDTGKRVSGIKRHLVVDTQGLPHAIQVTTASATDRHAALEMFRLQTSLLSAVTPVFVKGGYSGVSKNYSDHCNTTEFWDKFMFWTPRGGNTTCFQQPESV